MPQDQYPRAFKDTIDDNDFEISRLSVPGGWLVCIEKDAEFQSLFIADPQHEWQYET